MDSLDYGIIDLLRQNARAGYGDIGEVIGLSASAVSTRGPAGCRQVIRGFTTRSTPPSTARHHRSLRRTLLLPRNCQSREEPVAYFLSPASRRSWMPEPSPGVGSHMRPISARSSCRWVRVSPTTWTTHLGAPSCCRSPSTERARGIDTVARATYSTTGDGGTLPAARVDDDRRVDECRWLRLPCGRLPSPRDDAQPEGSPASEFRRSAVLLPSSSPHSGIRPLPVVAGTIGDRGEQTACLGASSRLPSSNLWARAPDRKQRSRTRRAAAAPARRFITTTGRDITPTRDIRV
jgi:hypothetical protein